MEELKEGWRRVKLGEISDIGSSKRIFMADYRESGVPFFRGKEIIQKSKGNNITTELYITEEKYNEIKNKFEVPQKGDILLTSVGTIGVPYLVKNNEPFYFKDGNVTWIKKYRDGVYNKYIYQWIKSPLGQNQINQVTIGSTQKALTIDALKKLEINLPPLEIQEKIASILSALDDKIEINNEMNKTLEEMAQTLFKRWFIDFDFPNENGDPYRSSGGKMVDSELGEIPEGWEVGAIKEIGEVITGKTPSTKNKENYGGKIPFITIPDMHGKIFITNTERYLSEIGNRVQSKKLLPVNSIIVSCIATVGLVSLNIRPSHTNQQINSIVPKSQNTLFYFFNTIKTLEDKLKMIGSAGTTTLNVNKSAFENIRIVFPNLKLMETYNNFVKNMYLKIKDNQQEIQSLTEIRDTLLPKFMSGEVEV